MYRYNVGKAERLSRFFGVLWGTGNPCRCLTRGTRPALTSGVNPLNSPKTADLIVNPSSFGVKYEHMSDRISTSPSPSPALFRMVQPLMRLIWVMIAILVIMVMAAALPVRLEQLLTEAENNAATLETIQLSPTLYAFYFLFVDYLPPLVFTLIGLFLFTSHTDSPMTLFTSTMLLSVAVTFSPLVTQALVMVFPGWQLAVSFLQGMGAAATVTFFYVFPDGYFIPPWTRWASLFWLVLSLLWGFVPNVPLNPFHHPDSMTVLVLGLGASSLIYVQFYRYQQVSTPLQRQQTKWIIFGLTMAVLGYTIFAALHLNLPMVQESATAALIFNLWGPLFLNKLPLILVPLAIAFSIVHYRLWDIDFVINQALVWGVFTLTLSLATYVTITLVQLLFLRLTGAESTLALILSTVIIAAVFQPWWRTVQHQIDIRFNRSQLDRRKQFFDFARNLRTFISLSPLLGELTRKTADLLQAEYSALFLRQEDNTFTLAHSWQIPPEMPVEVPRAVVLYLSTRPVLLSERNRFHVIVPLYTPLVGRQMVIGYLALGPRQAGKRYAREERYLLTHLADQGGSALRVAQLIEKQQEEMKRREEAERQLEAIRRSPSGRAAALATELIAQPHTVLDRIHTLAQTAGQDLSAAALLDNLPKALSNLDHFDLAHLATGFNYLFTSQYTPELLPIGLRHIIEALTNLGDQLGPDGAEALAVYRLCQQALEAHTIPQITALRPHLAIEEGFHSTFTVDLACTLTELQSPAEAHHAYERVESAEDRLAYLVSAVDGLRHVDVIARSDLGRADRPLIQHIVANWLAITTGAMSELHTRARLICQLVTRRTWEHQDVPLVLSLTNVGRGMAVKVRISLAPSSQYERLDEAMIVEQLAYGDEVQVTLKVRPQPPAGQDHFRARFVIQYADPSGADQMEQFADVVSLMTTSEGKFRFIPNPYVVGTPLQPGSRLFFGREDVLQFVQENLAAAHRNNLVLIGQRRTGKTSILKQLPVRLGDEFVPVYLDGQAMGLDPGLDQFFLSLATEITFALEDRGFHLPLPKGEDFAENPAAKFENDFLRRVAQAIEGRHILVLFDEFEELETAVRRGRIDPAIFNYLRHLMQHTQSLSIIFCGTHRLEELASDYWNVLFNISLYKQVGFLDRAEALRLIQEPIAAYGMAYDDLALDKMWRVTAGHPYFLQLMCHSLVNRHNKLQKSYLTIADVNTALDDILSVGEAHFIYLWTEASPPERLVLTALSHMMPVTGHATPGELLDYLEAKGAMLMRPQVEQALHNLTLRDILQVVGDGDRMAGRLYRWRLGLLGLWVEKFKSIRRVVDEWME